MRGASPRGATVDLAAVPAGGAPLHRSGVGQDQDRPADAPRTCQGSIKINCSGCRPAVCAGCMRCCDAPCRSQFDGQLITGIRSLSIDPPSMDTKEIHPLSADEAHRFLLAVRGYWLEARWILGVWSACARARPLGCPGRTSTSTRALCRCGRLLQYRRAKALQLVQPKTYRSRRTVPLQNSIVTALMLRREQQGGRPLMPPGSSRSEGRSFTTKLGTPFAPRNDYRNFLLLLERADFRASGCTICDTRPRR